MGESNMGSVYLPQAYTTSYTLLVSNRRRLFDSAGPIKGTYRLECGSGACSHGGFRRITQYIVIS